jgi:hypothetical protein
MRHLVNLSVLLLIVLVVGLIIKSVWSTDGMVFFYVTYLVGFIAIFLLVYYSGI